MTMPVIKTLDDLLNRKDRYDVNNILFYKTNRDGDLVIPDTTLFDIYIRHIRSYVASYETTTENQERYRCRPTLLSADFYGTPSLDWMILKLNDRECPSKFYLKRTVNLIPPSRLSEVFDLLTTKSADRLKLNQRKFLRLVGEDVVGS